MLISRLVIVGLCICLLLTAAVSLADQTDEARAVAMTILQKLEQKKNSEVWESHESNWFKERTTKPAFLANMTLIQSQLGGIGSHRELVQQNLANSSPQVGYRGEVYSFMFATTFPSANVYEMIVMIKEDSTYRLSGIQYTPNPNVSSP